MFIFQIQTADEQSFLKWALSDSAGTILLERGGYSSSSFYDKNHQLFEYEACVSKNGCYYFIIESAGHGFEEVDEEKIGRLSIIYDGETKLNMFKGYNFGLRQYFKVGNCPSVGNCAFSEVLEDEFFYFSSRPVSPNGLFPCFKISFGEGGVAYMTGMYEDAICDADLFDSCPWCQFLGGYNSSTETYKNRDGSFCEETPTRAHVTLLEDPSLFETRTVAVSSDDSCEYNIQITLNACSQLTRAPTVSPTTPSPTLSPSVCSGGLVQFELTLVTDQYPAETMWMLVRQSGGVTVLSRYGYELQYMEYIAQECLQNECYEFSIYDTGNNGICCGYGEGSYSIKYDGKLIFSGAQFTFEERTYVGSCVPASTTAAPV